MKRLVVLIVLALLITGCEPSDFFDWVLDQTPTPAATPTAVTETVKVVEVSVSFQSADAAKPLEVGSTGVLTLKFSPAILTVWIPSDGSIWNVSGPNARRWENHSVSQMRYCVAPDQPCSVMGELRPFEETLSTKVKLDWLGERKFFVSAQFLDRDGKPVLSDEYARNGLVSSNRIEVEQAVTTAFYPTTALEKLPAPVLTAVAATRAALPGSGPVRGLVKIEGSPCCRGATAGTTITLNVDFQASSTAGKVTEMRVNRMCSQDPADMKAAWEPYAPARAFTTTVTLNWTTFSIGVQYRDEKGNLSEIYCDSLGVEGSPARPTQKP